MAESYFLVGLIADTSKPMSFTTIEPMPLTFTSAHLRFLRSTTFDQLKPGIETDSQFLLATSRVVTFLTPIPLCVSPISCSKPCCPPAPTLLRGVFEYAEPWVRMFRSVTQINVPSPAAQGRSSSLSEEGSAGLW